MSIEYKKPKEIEKRSMELIELEMQTVPPRNHAPIIKRVIHTTADFEYEHTLAISESAVGAALAALRGGTPAAKSAAAGLGNDHSAGVFSPDVCTSASDLSGRSYDTDAFSPTTIVTDTNMALSGINKAALSRLGIHAVCYMADLDVAEEAQARGVTRAVVSMEKAARLSGRLIFAIGNAPTALLRLKELIDQKQVSPELIIGVPVGFVNVAEAKESIMTAGVPYIVARGRKGGSTVAAAICNALLYMAEDESYL